MLIQLDTTVFIQGQHLLPDLPIKQRDVYSLESFNHCCLWNILGISRAQQIVQHVSNKTIRARIGLFMPLADMIASHRLCWLGHLARMNEFRLPLI